MTENDANPWQQYWGESYGLESKQQLLKPVFGELEREEKIGNLIIDVGSGASPVTRLLKASPARKRICIDIATDNAGSLNDLRIRLDAEKVGPFGSLSLRRALLRVCSFLGINPKTEAKTERADAIVFSDMVELRRFSKGPGWVWEISETGGEGYCLQFAQSVDTDCYFPTRVSKIIVSFMHF